jgi:hypothetical protein
VIPLPWRRASTRPSSAAAACVPPYLFAPVLPDTSVQRVTTADDADCRAQCAARASCEGYAVIGTASCYTCLSFAINGFGPGAGVTAGYAGTCADGRCAFQLVASSGAPQRCTGSPTQSRARTSRRDRCRAGRRCDTRRGRSGRRGPSVNEGRTSSCASMQYLGPSELRNIEEQGWIVKLYSGSSECTAWDANALFSNLKRRPAQVRTYPACAGMLARPLP